MFVDLASADDDRLGVAAGVVAAAADPVRLSAAAVDAGAQPALRGDRGVRRRPAVDCRGGSHGPGCWHGLARYGRSEEQFFPGALVLALVVIGADRRRGARAEAGRTDADGEVAARRVPRRRDRGAGRRTRQSGGARSVAMGGDRRDHDRVERARRRSRWPWRCCWREPLRSRASMSPRRRRASPLAFYRPGRARDVRARRRSAPAAGAAYRRCFMGRTGGCSSCRDFRRCVCRLDSACSSMLSLVVAAAVAFGRLTATLSPRARRLTAAVAAVVLLFEGWPQHCDGRLPAPLPLGAFGGGDAAILELPAGRVEGDTAAMFRSIGRGVADRERLQRLRAGPLSDPENGARGGRRTRARRADSRRHAARRRRQQRAGAVVVAGAAPSARGAADRRWRLALLSHPSGTAGSPNVPRLARLPIVAATALDHPEDAARLIRR